MQASDTQAFDVERGTTATKLFGPGLQEMRIEPPVQVPAGGRLTWSIDVLSVVGPDGEPLAHYQRGSDGVFRMVLDAEPLQPELPTAPPLASP